MKLCFGRDMNCTQGTEETAALVDSMTALTRNFALIKHFPFLGTTLQSFPNPVLALLLPGFVDFRRVSGSRDDILSSSRLIMARLTPPFHSNVPCGPTRSVRDIKMACSLMRLAARPSSMLSSMPSLTDQPRGWWTRHSPLLLAVLRPL